MDADWATTSPRDPATAALVTKIQEQERAAIADQFDRGPASTLVNLILEAEICERTVSTDPERALSGLRDLRLSIHRSLQTIRRFIFDIHPVALEELGLLPAVRRFVDDWNAQEHRPVTFEGTGEGLR